MTDYREPSNERASSEVPEIRALVGRGTRFEGTLIFEGRARVDGTLVGAVRGDGVVVLGPSAHVEGEIEAETVLVLGGRLRGRVRATKLVEVHAGAEVEADLTAPLLDIARGAVITGRCDVVAAAPPPRADASALLDAHDDDAPPSPAP